MTGATLTILGCSGSAGVPAIGNQWGQCDPMEPRNRRTRPSALVRSETTTLIIDTGPDFHAQANRAGVERLDAVLFTHGHGDHINGFEEIRVLRKKDQGLLPLYADERTQNTLKTKFSFMFFDGDTSGYYPLPVAFKGWKAKDLQAIQRIGDIEFTLVPMIHGPMTAIGYRFGDVAYCTDVSIMPEDGFKVLEGVETLIIDCNNMFNERSELHLDFNGVLNVNEHVHAKDVILTHIKNNVDYKSVGARLPNGYRLAYDGLQIAI
jgi:phosphoribosyl 1,2-cyclic phosphate phosphodiesterase